MRGITIVLLLVWGCDKENAGIEEAQRQAEKELAAKVKVDPAKTMKTPVPGLTKIPCTQLMNVEAYQTALSEKEPFTLKDVTPPKGDEITASCDLVRGGKKMTDAEQQALLKKDGRLGILSGDIVCNVRALCYTIEEIERYKKRCAEKKDKPDDSMGSFACVQVVGTGRFDVNVYRFLDEDTKCVIEVRGGPSNTDNDMILACAKTARDTIGPAQIAVKAP
ncbi:MAG: hypothetical protein ABI867_19950 [Kofleriaceae bacterium]